ncbi:hypothetical protein QMT03_07270 [Cronobacter sakazakii]|nr:hypothetical protein [Cronobacter sakazakii]
MAYTLKPKQLAIVNFIEEHGVATPRQICRLLSCNSREANDRLRHLRIAGIIKNTGKPRHPEYRLVQRWRQKLLQTSHRCAAPAITELCRKNWQGYQIHKIIGRAEV